MVQQSKRIRIYRDKHGRLIVSPSSAVHIVAKDPEAAQAIKTLLRMYGEKAWPPRELLGPAHRQPPPHFPHANRLGGSEAE